MSGLSKLQKAALVLEHLPANKSTRLRNRLGSEDLCSVFQAINNLEVTDVQPFFDALAELAKESQKEFVRNPSDSEKGKTEGTMASGPEELEAAADNPFGFLLTRSATEVSSLICDEHPRDIAMILLHLPKAIAANLIRNLEPVQRISVVRRMCDLTPEDSGFKTSLVLALKHRLQKRDSSAKTCQKRKEHIAGIMELVGNDVSQQLGESLRGRVPLLDEIARKG